MYKHLITADGETFSSNLPTECTSCMFECKHLSQSIKCHIDGQTKRTGKIIDTQGGVFLCSNKEIKASGKFKQTLSTYFDVLSEIINIRDEQSERKAKQLRRLTHNLISYNAHILQDLYSIVSQDKLSGNGRDQAKAFAQALKSHPNDSAVSLLRILKNTNLSKSEFSIFEKLYDSNPSLDIHPHKIHKVLLLVFNSFWYDFIQKNVRIKIQPCETKLRLDYESVSAAFAHIIDNTVKYTATGTEVEVSFSSVDNSFIIEFEMISMRIEPEERYLIFNEGYSGRHPVRAELSGKGIGLGTIRKLLAINNATISIKSSDRAGEVDLDGYPYQKNVVKVVFNNYLDIESNTKNIKTGFIGRSLRSRRQSKWNR
ncbi:MAG: hypothetical protein AB2556_09410 [Candidatus Thiodiazotropha sp.]